MRGQKDLITMKKGVNNIENQGENRPSLCQMISETKCGRDKQIILQKERVNKIELGIKKGHNGIRKCQKQGTI